MKHLSLVVLTLVWSSVGAQTDTGLTFDQLAEQTGVETGAVTLRDHPNWQTPKVVIVRDIGVPIEVLQDAAPSLQMRLVATPEEARMQLDGADALIGWCASEFVDAGSDLLWMQVYSAGVERCLENDAIMDGSVVLTNMQKMSSPVLAEHMVAMTLALARALPQYAKVMPDGRWQREMSSQMQSVAGKTLLVVGLGGIGTEVARRADALGMRVIGTRRSRREAPDFVDYVGLSDELPTLLEEADFVLNALPLTEETAGLFDAEMLGRMKPGAFYLNVGRGGTVVTDDLVAALESGAIAGAGLDVTDPEPLPADHVLWQMDNVIITPHVAGRGSNRERHIILLRENLRRFAAGDALYNVVDPADGY